MTNKTEEAATEILNAVADCADTGSPATMELDFGNRSVKIDIYDAKAQDSLVNLRKRIQIAMEQGEIVGKP